MTVAELIDALKAFDPSMQVVASGFDESGYDDISNPEVVEIVKISENRSHSGMYVNIEDSRRYLPIGKPFRAIHIDF